MTNGGNESDDNDNGGKPVGYKSPPLNGRIKPGEKRNPYGRNGRPGRARENVDVFGKVAGRMTRVNIDGETMMVPSEESFWLKQMHMAHQGDKAAARNIAREFGARRKLGPQPPTAEELAQQEADHAKKEELAKHIVDLLEEKADAKRNGECGCCGAVLTEGPS